MGLRRFLRAELCNMLASCWEIIPRFNAGGRAAEVGPLSQTLVALVICINSSDDDKDSAWFRSNETVSWEASFCFCLSVFFLIAPIFY